MICKNCGASISELESRCPYCDSFIEREDEWDGTYVENNQSQPNNLSGFLSPENDKINPILLIASFIPLVGIILGAITLSSGMKKSGTAYLLAGVSVFLLPFAGVILTLVLGLILGK